MKLKSKSAIVKMVEGGKIHASVMQKMIESSRPGVSTLQLDKIAEQEIERWGARASFKGYRGFPASICASLNDEIVHGIPRADRVLTDGDLLKLDLGIYFKGHHTDAGRTVTIGDVSPTAAKLKVVAQEAFNQGVKALTISKPLNQVGKRIERYAQKWKFTVVRELVGHGVGEELHEDPEVPNYYRADLTTPICEGMALAIEPMINAGTWRVRTLSDKWTVVTYDGKLSAYYEDTVIITSNGPLIVTDVRYT